MNWYLPCLWIRITCVHFSLSSLRVLLCFWSGYAKYCFHQLQILATLTVLFIHKYFPLHMLAIFPIYYFLSISSHFTIKKWVHDKLFNEVCHMLTGKKNSPAKVWPHSIICSPGSWTQDLGCYLSPANQSGSRLFRICSQKIVIRYEKHFFARVVIKYTLIMLDKSNDCNGDQCLIKDSEMTSICERR